MLQRWEIRESSILHNRVKLRTLSSATIAKYSTSSSSNTCVKRNRVKKGNLSTYCMYFLFEMHLDGFSKDETMNKDKRTTVY